MYINKDIGKLTTLSLVKGVCDTYGSPIIETFEKPR
jgi:hypothetical protein